MKAEQNVVEENDEANPVPEYTRGWHDARKEVEKGGSPAELEHLINKVVPSGPSEAYNTGWEDFMGEAAHGRGI